MIDFLTDDGNGGRKKFTLADLLNRPDALDQPLPDAPEPDGEQRGFVAPSFRRQPQSAPPLPDAGALPPQQYPAPAPPDPQQKQLTPRGPMSPDDMQRGRQDRLMSQMQDLMRPQQRKFGLKDYLLTGAAGFAAGAGTPNIAHGGGTDLMRGGMAGFQTGLGIANQSQDRAEEQRLHNAEIAQKAMQAVYESQRPDMAYWQHQLQQDKLAEEKRKDDLLHGDHLDATNAKLTLGNKSIDLRDAAAKWTQSLKASQFGMDAAKAGFQQPGATAADLGAGPIQLKPETDPTKLTIPQQDRHTQAGLMAKYYDARTGEIKERTSMMPDILNIRKQLLAARLADVSDHAQRTQIAKNEFNWNYKGLDENGNQIFDSEDGKIVIPKVEAMNKVPATMQTKAASADGVIKSADDIIAKVNQLRDEGVIGPLMGRVQSLKLAAGMSNPEVKALQVALDNMAQIQVPLHGAKGVGMQKIIKDSTGGIAQDPDNVIAAMNEAKRMAGTLGTSNRTIYKPKNRTQNTGSNVPAAGAAPAPAQGGGTPAGYTPMVKPDGSKTYVPTDKVKLKQQPPFNYKAYTGQ